MRVNTFAQYMQEAAKFTLSEHVKNIRCPVLVTQAEADPVGAFAPVFYDALSTEKSLVKFSAAEGADGHCQTNARSIYHQRAYDWLSELFESLGKSV